MFASPSLHGVGSINKIALYYELHETSRSAQKGHFGQPHIPHRGVDGDQGIYSQFIFCYESNECPDLHKSIMLASEHPYWSSGRVES